MNDEAIKGIEVHRVGQVTEHGEDEDVIARPGADGPDVVEDGGRLVGSVVAQEEQPRPPLWTAQVAISYRVARPTSTTIHQMPLLGGRSIYIANDDDG